MFKDKTIVVTGGLGLVGSNLVRRLLYHEPKKIIVLDDKSVGTLSNLFSNCWDDRVDYYYVDVSNLFSLQNIFKRKPDIVFHLSAHMANEHSILHPYKDLCTNGIGTLNMLSVSKGCEKFIYASADCSIRGNPDKVDGHLYHDTPYQIHKMLGETYCNYFNKEYNVPICKLRFSNVYGEGEELRNGDFLQVIPRFIKRGLERQPLYICGDGSQTRSFIYVQDLVDGIIECSKITDNNVTQTIGGHTTNLMDLSRIICEETGNLMGDNPNVKFIKDRSWDSHKHRSVDLEKQIYKPKTDLHTGIKNTTNWIRDYLGVEYE